MDKRLFIQACREGGGAIEQALRTLDRSFHAVLYREGCRAMRDSAAAHDLVQETLIKVWQRCGTFHGDSELLPWIRTIMRHGILDRLRRVDREVPLESGGQIVAAVERRAAAPGAAPDDELRRRELASCFRRCWQAFECAAPTHAAVMTWIVEDGLGNDEISELLGRTPGATREFVSQCRKKARIHLAEWYELAQESRR